jgi:hypothetical protein
MAHQQTLEYFAEQALREVEEVRPQPGRAATVQLPRSFQRLL